MPKATPTRTRNPSERVRGSEPSKSKNPKSVACQRCHSRKVKCSGEHPCSNCRSADLSDECMYPSRDRKIKLSQQYVDELLKENERLRGGSATVTPSSDDLQPGQAQPTVENQETVQNPLLEDRPWFLPISSQDMPIHINEAADAAFATRFRQTLATSGAAHLPRESYIRDERLLVLSESQFSWPSPAKARFLVKVSLNTVCRYYHIVRKSVVLESLENAIRRGGEGERLEICKLLTLFALGEAYSCKTGAQGKIFPGLAYFARARHMVSIPAERPQVDTIEIALLFVIYSYALNRRHAAYIFASSAVRLGIVMGMNMNVPEHQYRNRLAREHRTRLWWTAYIMDCTCSSKLGLPASIAEEDISLDLPSNDGLGEDHPGDFGDLDCVIKSIELAKLTAQSVNAIYSRRKHSIPFSQRVQASLKNLTKWMESLPASLHLKSGSEPSVVPNHIVYLHLTFNQCVILITRPILLHVLRFHQQSQNVRDSNARISLPDSALTLAETCIQCARHSYRLLTEAWIHGAFAIFDYFNTQYLFSAATILAVSSLLGSSQSQCDGDNYNNAVELLQQLDQSGNFGAHEFCEHIAAMKESMENVANSAIRHEVPRQLATFGQNQDGVFTFTGSAMTAGMALAEPSLQEFLAETDLGIQAFDNSPFDGLQTSYWPEMWGNGWGAGGDS